MAVTVDKAITYVFNLSNKKQINGLAHSFRRSTLKSFEESKPLSWPPSPEKFNSVSVDKQNPKNVKVLILDSECHDNERVETLALSKGQWVTIFLLAFDLVIVTEWSDFKNVKSYN